VVVEVACTRDMKREVMSYQCSSSHGVVVVVACSCVVMSYVVDHVALKHT
jgi:hypothetical protein